MSAIEATACEPRLGRGGRYESQETARSRGNLDVALISLMRDAMLRVSEAAALSSMDIESAVDGTGRLLIRRSKTDAEGQRAVAFLSAPTMAALALIRNEATAGDSVFGLRPNQISARIKQAAQAADLGGGYSGHSPRVGMARNLSRAGAELPSLMNAGRWRSPAMPAHYTRNESAARGAVAQFLGAIDSTLRRLADLGPQDVQPARAVRVELQVAPPERRDLGAAEQAVPHHLQEGQVHCATSGRLNLGLLASALALVDPLDPGSGLQRGQGLAGRTLGLLPGFPVLPAFSWWPSPAAAWSGPRIRPGGGPRRSPPGACARWPSSCPPSPPSAPGNGRRRQGLPAGRRTGSRDTSW